MRSVMLVLALAMPAVFAQEGHPLSGTWHGSWKSGADSKPVVFFLRWDNKNIVGEINPGRNAMPLKVATLNADTWTVHFEADTKDGQKVVIDGKIENLGSYYRQIKGTYAQGAAKGALEMTRD